MTALQTPAAAVLVLLGLIEPALRSADFLPEPAGGSPSADIDEDVDGVPDSRDACPQTPPGYPSSATGCALDTDGDGVADGRDACPGTRPGASGIDVGVDPDGCSVRDRRKERDFHYSLGVG